MKGGSEAEEGGNKMCSNGRTMLRAWLVPSKRHLPDGLRMDHLLFFTCYFSGLALPPAGCLF